MGNESKIIRKTDESAMQLLKELSPDLQDNITDIDSYYLVNGTYVFLEFIHCAGQTITEDLSIEENKLLKQVSNIWDFVKLAEGRLWLIFFNELKDNFLLKQVVSSTAEELVCTKVSLKTADEFKAWFQLINQTVLQNKVKADHGHQR